MYIDYEFALRTETHPKGVDFVNRKLSEKAHFLETEAI